MKNEELTLDIAPNKASCFMRFGNVALQIVCVSCVIAKILLV